MVAAYSVAAIRTVGMTTNVSTRAGVMSVTPDDEDELVRRVMAQALITFPPDEGWCGHVWSWIDLNEASNRMHGEVSDANAAG